MPSVEFAPAPHTEIQEVATERFPHFGIPGFERLPPNIKQRFLRIPASHLEAARPTIEVRIKEATIENGVRSDGQADRFQADGLETAATSRETQALEAIDTFHRAEKGDKDAKKDLQDAKKELLGEEPSDEDIFKMMLENESGDPFAQDMIIEIMLSDETSEAHQKVLDLFKDYRGDLASVDDALSPKRQIEFFTKLTKGQGSFHERLEFAEKTLEWITSGDTDNLFEGLHARNILDGTELNDNAIEALQKGIRKRIELGTLKASTEKA